MLNIDDRLLPRMEKGKIQDGIILNPYQIAVLLRLGRRMDAKRVCFPSVPTIAKECGISTSKVRRTLSELSDLGMIIIQKRSKDGLQLANAYFIATPFIQYYTKNSTVPEIVLPEKKGGTVPETGGTVPESDEVLTIEVLTNRSINQKEKNQKKKSELKNSAETILQKLNSLSGRNFQLTETNITLIEKMLNKKSCGKKINVADVLKMIEFKCFEWVGNEKMQKFLRPQTLFGNKAIGYIEEAREVAGNQNALHMFRNSEEAKKREEEEKMRIYNEMIEKGLL